MWLFFIIVWNYLYPIPSGGIVAEWTIGAWEASAEIDELGSLVTLNSVNMNTDKVIDIVIELQSTELTTQFMAFMSEMLTDEEPPDATNFHFHLTPNAICAILKLPNLNPR